jgi:hypothetical protein
MFLILIFKKNHDKTNSTFKIHQVQYLKIMDS